MDRQLIETNYTSQFEQNDFHNSETIATFEPTKEVNLQQKIQDLQLEVKRLSSIAPIKQDLVPAESIDLPATEKQMSLLEQHGFSVPQGLTKIQASEAIGSIAISQKQAKLLCAFGFDVLGITVNKRMSKVMFNEAEKKGAKPNWDTANKYQEEIDSRYKQST